MLPAVLVLTKVQQVMGNAVGTKLCISVTVLPDAEWVVDFS